VLADLATQAKRRPGTVIVLAPLAVEAVSRIDRIDIERAINGKSQAERLAVRRELAAPLVADLEQWMRAQRASMSRDAPVAKAMDYMLKDWPAFTRFLDDGRVCLTNNPVLNFAEGAAERALRGIALGRKSWLFAGSDRGGERAALYSLIVTTKLNDIDPQAWLADVLARVPDLSQGRRTQRSPRTARSGSSIVMTKPTLPRRSPHHDRCRTPPGAAGRTQAKPALPNTRDPVAFSGCLRYGKRLKTL